MRSLQTRIRRCRAQAAIDAYCETAGASLGPDEALIDLLTDLRHWSNGIGLDFSHALDHSSFHFDAEVQS